MTTPSIQLYAMSDSEYVTWKARSMVNYAADKQRSNGVTREEAERIARADFERYLPNGLNSSDSFLFSAKDESGTLIGTIWLLVRGPANDRRGFVGDVIVEEAFRGKGFGRAIMNLAEVEARKMGLGRIALHVFGYNEPAIRLYQSLGYVTTDINMEKTL